MRHPALRRIRFCNLLGLCQQGPTLRQNEPRPSLVAIAAAVCVANAFSHLDATVVTFGHRYSMMPKAYRFLLLPISLAIGSKRRRNTWLNDVKLPEHRRLVAAIVK
jgi:hypothetical protein